jgi:hypothetical protein
MEINEFYVSTVQGITGVSLQKEDTGNRTER